jgi:hypothetical protein
MRRLPLQFLSPDQITSDQQRRQAVPFYNPFTLFLFKTGLPQLNRPLGVDRVRDYGTVLWPLHAQISISSSALYNLHDRGTLTPALKYRVSLLTNLANDPNLSTIFPPKSCHTKGARRVCNGPFLGDSSVGRRSVSY